MNDREPKRHKGGRMEIAKPSCIDRLIQLESLRCKKSQRAEFEKLRQIVNAAVECAAPTVKLHREWLKLWLYLGVLRPTRIGPGCALYTVKEEMEGYLLPPHGNEGSTHCATDKLHRYGWYMLPYAYLELSILAGVRFIFSPWTHGREKDVHPGDDANDESGEEANDK